MSRANLDLVVKRGSDHEDNIITTRNLIRREAKTMGFILTGIGCHQVK